MAGLFETTWTLHGHLLDQGITLVIAARTELMLFCIAFALHHFLFGEHLPSGKKSAPARQQPKRLGVPGDGDCLSAGRQADSSRSFLGDDEAAAALSAGPMDLDQALNVSQIAYERGDHKTVLRLWNSTLKRSERVPALHVAHAAESMQRFKRDGALILSEVQSLLRRSRGSCGIDYVNELLEPLVKSLDTELVFGIFEYLHALDLKPDSVTYELLIVMYFTTRSFDEVSALAKQMSSNGVAPTTRTNLVLLKTALQLGHLDEAIRCFREVSTGTEPATASLAPKHIATQLVELACRDRRVEVVLEELETGSMPTTPEMLNAMLTECARAKNPRVAKRVQALATTQAVEANARTYTLFIRMAQDDHTRVAQLLDEMIEKAVECSQDVCFAVLAACTPTRDTALADKLYALVRSTPACQIPVFLALMRFYSDAGQAEKVCQIYDLHLDKAHSAAGDEKRGPLMDARTERCLIGSALQCGRTDLTATLVQAAPADTAKHISMIRMCAAKGNLDDALAIFGALEKSGAELTHSLYNTCLDACVECGALNRAEELLMRMESAGIADAVSYNTFIKAYLRRDGYDYACGVIEKMKKAGFTPNQVTYNELINALVKSETESRRAQVWDVVEEMRGNGTPPNRVTCSIMLKSLKAKSSHADVTRTMELTTGMGEPMDEVLLSSIVEACVRVGRPALLAQKLAELQGKVDSITVTGAHTFGSLIKAYGHAKDIAGAWRCWKEMRLQHIKPTSITIGCMIEAVVTNGDVDGGWELITQLLEDDQCRNQLNAVVFGSVLKGYGRARRMERVWAVFTDMLSRGIEPSVVTFNAVIDACARNGQMDAVPKLMEDMRARRLEANLITYSTVIKGFCHRGDMPAALQTLEDMQRTAQLKPDEIVYNTLLDGCCSAGLIAEGERLLAAMMAGGICPSNFTLTVVVRLMGQARLLDRAFELVESITRKYRFKANSHVTGALIQACLSSRELKRAVAVFEQAVVDRSLPDPRTSQGLVRALAASGNAEKAVNVLRAALRLSGGPHQDGGRGGGGAGGGGGRGGGGGGGGGGEKNSGLDDAFVGEFLSSLVDRGGEGAALVPALLADIRAMQPRRRIDAAAERKVASVNMAGGGR